MRRFSHLYESCLQQGNAGPGGSYTGFRHYRCKDAKLPPELWRREA